jgi:2-dehydro-3-deoxygluconokinase
MSVRVVTLGEPLAVIRGSTIGPAEHLDGLRLTTGGAEANVAIGLRRLGVEVAFIGRVGDDSVGRRILRELRAEGVDARVRVDADGRTGLLLKESFAGGRARVTYWREGSSGSRTDPSDIVGALDQHTALVHVTGITPALSASAEAATRAIVADARERGAVVSFDVNHRAGLWGSRDPRDTYLHLLRAADIVFAGADEARLAVGADEKASPTELAQAIAATGPGEVVIKLGAAGALAYRDGRIVHRDAVAVSVVDTVGAGDAFVAGYLYEHLRGSGLEQRLDTAVRTGAGACENPGDWEGALTLVELATFGTPADPVVR